MQRILGIVALLPLLAPLTLVSGCGTVLPDLPDCNNLGTDGPALKATAVLRAVDELSGQAEGLADELLMVCSDMARELGVTPPAPTGDQTEREATCDAVAAEIQTIIAGAGGSVSLMVEPAQCAFSVEGYAECVARCDVDVSADVQVECMGGELSGSCMGMCMGSCTVEASATCAGRCDAQCTGSCTGTCTGECSGGCSAMDDNGQCVGSCDAECTGSCSGTCTGGCTGSCVAEIEGRCQGECRGMCNVEFEAPRCDGSADVMASVECQTTCDAELSATATCTEPRVRVVYDGEMVGGRVADLRRTLQVFWPSFLSLKARIENTTSAAADVVDAASDLRDSSVATAICFVSAANAAAEAAASFEVSITVTVSVSASVTAG